MLLVVAIGYVQPLRAYQDAKHDVAVRRAEVDRTARANVELEARIAEASTAAFVEREARKLGLVRPGERLFIVTGIEHWQREKQARATERPKQ